jgi:hypothetical protein
MRVAAVIHLCFFVRDVLFVFSFFCLVSAEAVMSGSSLTICSGWAAMRRRNHGPDAAFCRPSLSLSCSQRGRSRCRRRHRRNPTRFPHRRSTPLTRTSLKPSARASFFSL